MQRVLSRPSGGTASAGRRMLPSSSLALMRLRSMQRPL